MKARPSPGWSDDFRRFVESREGVVKARLASFAEGPDHLDDLLQETWTRCFERWEQYRGEGRTGWVLAVARSIAIDDYRTRRRRREMARRQAVEVESPTTLSRLEVDQIRRELSAAFHALTEREREVIRLRFLSGVSTRDVALMLGISESTVRVHQANALGKLRAILAKEGR